MTGNYISQNKRQNQDKVAVACTLHFKIFALECLNTV